MKIRRLGRNPDKEGLDVGMTAQACIVLDHASEGRIGEMCMERSMTDGVDGDRRPAATAFWFGVMPFDPSPERPAAKPTDRIFLQRPFHVWLFDAQVERVKAYRAARFSHQPKYGIFDARIPFIS